MRERGRVIGARLGIWFCKLSRMSFPRKRESRATATSLALDPRFRGGDSPREMRKQQAFDLILAPMTSGPRGSWGRPGDRETRSHGGRRVDAFADQLLQSPQPPVVNSKLFQVTDGAAKILGHRAPGADGDSERVGDLAQR